MTDHPQAVGDQNLCLGEGANFLLEWKGQTPGLPNSCVSLYVTVLLCAVICPGGDGRLVGLLWCRLDEFIQVFRVPCMWSTCRERELR